VAVRAGARSDRGIAAVYGGSAHHYRALTEDKYAKYLDGGLLYLPELSDIDLTPYEALLIPERLHRGLLEKAVPPDTRDARRKGSSRVLFRRGTGPRVLARGCDGSTLPPTIGGG
jgi:hypothetical protein